MNRYIGIDAAGDTISYQIQNARGDALAEGRASKSGDGWAALKEACERASLRPGECTAVIEATGRHHLPWCERLHAEGFEVRELNPLLTKRLHSCENAIRDNKDDATDARTLCEIARVHGTKLRRFRYRPAGPLTELRSLVRARKCLRNQCTNLIKSAGDMIDMVFPELSGLNLGADGARVRALLREAPTPAALAEAPEELFERTVGSRKGAEVRRLAARSITPDSLSGECAAALQHMLACVDELAERLRALEKDIRRALRRRDRQSEDEALLRSIPGVGEASAAAPAAFLPAELIESGHSKKRIVARLQAYLGCDPRRRQSGKNEGKVKISKRGVETARTALYQASFCAMGFDPEMRAYYDKKKSEGDHHKKAVVDLMRKNMRRIVAVLVDRQPFERGSSHA